MRDQPHRSTPSTPRAAPLKFEHTPEPRNPALIRSTCCQCHMIVGTAADPLLLHILEDAHHCPLQPTQFSRPAGR